MAKTDHENLDPERVSPIGQLRLAIEYHNAAVAIHTTLSECAGGIAVAPAYANLGQAMELALKSLLLHDGWSPKDLAGKLFKHSIEKCLSSAKAERPELHLPEGYDGALKLFDTHYRAKEFAYFGRGTKRYPYFNVLRQISRLFLETAIQQLCVNDAMLKRRFLEFLNASAVPPRGSLTEAEARIELSRLFEMELVAERYIPSVTPVSG